MESSEGHNEFKSKHNPIKSLSVNGERVVKPTEIASKFNFFFTAIGSKLAAKFQTNNIHIDQTDLVEENFSFSQIEQSFVEKQLSTLCAAKATGIDSVNARLLKAAAPITAPSITHMLNVSINRGSVPDEWKRAKVTSVYKDGSHEDPSNYRPISILPDLSKLLERVVNGICKNIT